MTSPAIAPAPPVERIIPPSAGEAAAQKTAEAYAGQLEAHLTGAYEANGNDIEATAEALTENLKAARDEYAQALAARSGSTFTFRRGKKEQVEQAGQNYRMAVDARGAVAAAEIRQGLGGTPEEDDQTVRELSVLGMLGTVTKETTTDPDGTTVESDVAVKGEAQELAERVEHHRLVRAGARNADGSAVTGVKAKLNAVSRKWAEWSEQGWKGRLKKVGVAAGVGAAATLAVVGMAGTVAGTAAAAGAAGAARVSKAAASAKLQQKGETTLKAQAENEAIIKQARGRNHSQGFNTQDLVAGFNTAANRTTRRNRVRAGVAAVATGFGVFGASQLHDVIADKFGGASRAFAGTATSEVAHAGVLGSGGGVHNAHEVAGVSPSATPTPAASEAPSLGTSSTLGTGNSSTIENTPTHTPTSSSTPSAIETPHASTNTSPAPESGVGTSDDATHAATRTPQHHATTKAHEQNSKHADAADKKAAAKDKAVTTTPEKAAKLTWEPVGRGDGPNQFFPKIGITDQKEINFLRHHPELRKVMFKNGDGYNANAGIDGAKPTIGFRHLHLSAESKAAIARLHEEYQGNHPGTNADTTEAAPTASKPIELHVDPKAAEIGQTPRDVFIDAPGKFANNLEAFKDALAEAVKDGDIKLDTSDPEHVKYMIHSDRGPNGTAWVRGSVEDVVRILAEQTKDKYELAA
ncbi:MAG TPA: hypothetical protein VMY99_00680 [Nevskiaceae bacterium]|nr:hypothetical protein [Nevskiaceae bacterium]